MKRFSHIQMGLRWRWLAILLLSTMSMLPLVGRAQDDGGEQKPKKEKVEKPPKEKKEKPAKEVKEKPAKEKKEKPAKEEKEKRAKAKEDAGDDEADDEAAEEPKAKKKKKKKGQEEDEANAIPPDSAQLAQKNKPVDRSGAKHGNPAPCARYRRGSMEYIDLNDIYIAIKRKRHREIHYNGNRGIRAAKTRKISRDQKIDKSKSKIKLDKEGKPKDKGNKIVYKLKWVGDCEYNLIFKRSKKPTRFKKGWVMNCKIVTCYEDYYDCDCDMHDIMQYASVRKRMTKSEKARKDRMEAEAVAAFEEKKKKEEADSLKAAEIEAQNRAKEDEVFGPIKRIQSGNINESKRPDENEVKPGPAEKTVNPTPKPEPAPKPEKETKPEKEEKSDKAPKDKEEKVPKEKKEKVPKEKKEKVPKEKKEKAPKEKKEKAPKEKAEKAPQEKAEKAPKEKKEKAPKEDE